MIFIDAKIFGNNEIFNLMLDENACVEEAVLKLLENQECDSAECFVFSKRRRCILSKKLSFKEQGVSGGDRLILIRKEEKG